MFLLSGQNNFYIILSSYPEGHVKGIQKGMLQASKISMDFCKIYCGASFEIIFR